MFKLPKLTNYKTLYNKEKLRADLLQHDLDIVDELHYDEIKKLENCIDKLRGQLVRMAKEK